MMKKELMELFVCKYVVAFSAAMIAVINFI